MNIGDMYLEKDTQIWMYVLEKPEWDKIIHYNKGSKKTYFASNKEFNINENDIIIIYIIGAGKNTGFCSVSQTYDIFEETNGEHYIFNDINKNKFSLQIKTFVCFEKPIRLADIVTEIENCEDYNSVASFRKRYLSAKNNFKLIDFELGKQILTSINKLTINKDEQHCSDNDDNNVNDSQYSENDNSDNDNDRNSDLISEIDDSEENEIMNSLDSDSQSQSEEHSIEEDSEESQVSQVSQEGDVKYKIPILFEPCKKFKYKDENELINNILQHYLTCAKCTSTNNNGSELAEVLHNAKFSIDIVDSDDGELVNMMHAYHNSKPYKIKVKLVPEVRMLIINDTSDIYDGCILIGWNKIITNVDADKFLPKINKSKK